MDDILKFDEDIRNSFITLFPFSLISNVILYRNDRNQTDLYANEIDHLFHYKKDDRDHLVIVEVKKRRLFGSTKFKEPTPNSPWKLKYVEKIKDIKKQVRDQKIALRQFCLNVAKTMPEIECWIVDLRKTSQKIIVDEKDNTLNLLTHPGFKVKLEQITSVGSVIKVEHSKFLRELRKGIIEKDVGHPDISSGIKFIQICRKSLDDQIYRYFKPSPNFYAINGCAGMGKSVLLAYGTYVFASNFAIDFDDSKPQLAQYEWKFELLPRHKRKIYVYAVKKKQIQILKEYWEDIQKYISTINQDYTPALQKTIFRHWTGSINKDCNILIIDEAHDLSLSDQQTVANWFKDDNPKFPQKYLFVACDRNQSLKRKYSDEDIIDGLNFSRHSTRLNRVYRCPFPVYAASIGILFRWFACEGGSVVLSNRRLRENFAFRAAVVEENESSMTLSMRNDSHPGNNWKQTVSHFENCTTAYDHLSQFHLKREDVLWACFKKIEEDFDYNLIQKYFNFVDLQGNDADNEIDKNIKGQEFAVVIVEGLPTDLNPLQLKNKEYWGDNVSEIENKMWRLRRNVYITCSRASAFLYFVLDINNSDNENELELKNLIKQVAHSERGKNESGQTWTFKVNKLPIKRKPIVFKDVEDDDKKLFMDAPNIAKPDSRKGKNGPTKIIVKPNKAKHPKKIYIPTKSNQPNDNIPDSSKKSIPAIQFESGKIQRLRHIYGVLNFMKEGFGYTDAVKETLKLFPDVKDEQTIADKCARGFAGDTDTFKQWYYSGEILDRMKKILALSENDYKIFKLLLHKNLAQTSSGIKNNRTSNNYQKTTKRPPTKPKTTKTTRTIVNVGEIVSFNNTKYRWNGQQWLNVENYTIIPGAVIQKLNSVFIPVKRIPQDVSKNTGSYPNKTVKKNLNHISGKKTQSPPVSQWARKIPELSSYRFNTWKEVCDHLHINVGADSARRKIQKWVKENKPEWFQVPKLKSDINQ